VNVMIFSILFRLTFERSCGDGEECGGNLGGVEGDWRWVWESDLGLGKY
jgi:hypothetical protein